MAVRGRTTLPRMGHPRGLRGFPGMTPLARTRGTDPNLGTGATTAAPPAPPPMPVDWVGTPGEWVVRSWLTRNAVSFVYRDTSGPALPGGNDAAPAFTLPEHGVVIEVTGETASPGAQVFRLAAMRAAGQRVVSVDAVDLQTSLDETMSAALDGVSRST